MQWPATSGPARMASASGRRFTGQECQRTSSPNGRSPSRKLIAPCGSEGDAKRFAAPRPLPAALRPAHRRAEIAAELLREVDRHTGMHPALAVEESRMFV